MLGQATLQAIFPTKTNTMPSRLSLTSDAYAHETGEGSKDPSHGSQTFGKKDPANKCGKPGPSKSPNEESRRQSCLPSSTGPGKLQSTASPSMEYDPVNRTWSGGGCATRANLTEPAEYSPMRRWERASIREEPWSSVSALLAGNPVKSHRVEGSIGDPTWREDRRVRVEPAAISQETSSEREDRRGGIREVGPWADLVGVGTWL